MGWTDINVSISSDNKGVSVPFMVTKLKLDKPILGFNLIREFLHDSDIKYIFQDQDERTVDMVIKTLQI